MELEFHHHVLLSDPARFCLSVPSLRWYTMFYPLFFLLVYMGLLSCALETVCISLLSALEEGKLGPDLGREGQGLKFNDCHTHARQ